MIVTIHGAKYTMHELILACRYVNMYLHFNCLCTLKANEVKYILQVLYQNAKNGFTGNLLWVEISLEMPACQSCELDHNQIMTTRL